MTISREILAAFEILAVFQPAQARRTNQLDTGSRPPQESSHRWELNAHGYSMIGSFCAPRSRRARARRSQRAAGRKTALRNAALAAANPKILLLEFLLGDDPFIFMEQNALTTRSRMLLKGDEGGAKFGGGSVTSNRDSSLTTRRSIHSAIHERLAVFIPHL